jgi:Zn finger protein HypA/HybF involved in hydrogenase expression
MCPNMRKKNSDGGKQNYKINPNRNKHIKGTNRMNGWNNGGYNNTGYKFKYSLDDVFCENSTFANEYLKQRIEHSNLLEYKCSKCGIAEWCGGDIVLELHHVNGIRTDNRIENLQFLCPNCHSQTITFRGKNLNLGKIRVPDDKLISALKESKNIRQALLKVGMTPRGANYIRAKKLSAQIEISEVEQPKFGELLTSNVDDNPERSLEKKERVET